MDKSAFFVKPGVLFVEVGRPSGKGDAVAPDRGSWPTSDGQDIQGWPGANPASFAEAKRVLELNTQPLH